MTTATVISILLGTQSGPVDIAKRYMGQLQAATNASGSYELSISDDSIIRKGTVKFVTDQTGKIRQTTANSDEFFDGKFHYVRNKTNGTWFVRDARIWEAPLLPGLEPIVQNRNLQGAAKDLEIETAVNTRYKAANAIQIRGLGQEIFLSPTTALPVGFTVQRNNVRFAGAYNQVNLNVEVAPTEFQFTPNPRERQVPVLSPGLIAEERTLPRARDPKLQEIISATMAKSDYTILTFVRKGSSASIDLMKALSRVNRKSIPPAKVLAITASDSDIRENYVRMTPYVPVGVDSMRSGQSFAAACGVTKYPTVLVVNPNGKILHAEVGGIEGTLRDFLDDEGIRF